MLRGSLKATYRNALNKRPSTYLIKTLSGRLFEGWRLFERGAYIIASMVQVIYKRKIQEFCYLSLFTDTFYRLMRRSNCAVLRIKDFKIYIYINKISISYAKKAFFKVKSPLFSFETYLRTF